jgi:hypothetical protein
MISGSRQPSRLDEHKTMKEEQDLCLGPLCLEFSGEVASIADAWHALNVGFTPSDEVLPPRGKVRLKVDKGASAAPELGWEVRPFVHQSSGDLYVRENARLRMELSAREAAVALRISMRQGATVGAQFPKHVLMTVSAVGAIMADSALIHGCAMVGTDGAATLFLGASGDGKSTMSQRLPSWRLLADDTVCLEALHGESGVWVSGTPFHGSERLPRCGDRVPLARILILEPHAERLSLTSISCAQLYSALVSRVFCPLIDGPIPRQVTRWAERVALRVQGGRLASSLDHDVTGVLGDS